MQQHPADALPSAGSIWHTVVRVFPTPGKKQSQIFMHTPELRTLTCVCRDAHTFYEYKFK